MDVRRAVAALMLLGLLVSCSDDEPDSRPKEPTGSATPSSTRTRPVVPAAAQGADAASAKAFVRYWFEVFNRALNTGDSALLMELSAQDCVTCKAFRRNIRKAYADGGRVRALGWTPTSIRPVGVPEMPTFSLTVRQGKEEYLNASGEVDHYFPGGRRAMLLQLHRRDSIWRVQRLDIEQ